MRSLILLGIVAMCSGSPGEPDAGGAGGGSGGGSGGSGGAPTDGGKLAGCAPGETPPGPALSTTTALLGGWHYWGTRVNGVETAETNSCEVAKSFHFLPVGRLGPGWIKPPPDAGEEDAGDPTADDAKQTACASAHGVPIPISGLGVSFSAYQASCLVPCDPGDIRVEWDHVSDIGLPYQYTDAGRQLLTQRYRRVGDKLLLSTVGLNGVLYAKGAGALYCY